MNRIAVLTSGGDAPGMNAAIRAVEQKLGCTCGCTLDIFTCRTTDFTCTYSPALHREVIALASEGKTEQQIINRYRAGQVGYTEVVVAQASALNARRNVLQLQVAQQLAAIGLIQALGGGWQAQWMAQGAQEKSGSATN